MLKAPNYQAFFSVSLLYLKPIMLLLKRLIDEIKGNAAKKFTFHYASIKTKDNFKLDDTINLDLHFIMLLLKHSRKNKLEFFTNYLHFIMLLLKQ